MRFVFQGTDHPSALAKSLKKSLKTHGSVVGLRRCEETLAKMTGYANWHELRKVALSGEPRSARDHDAPIEVVSERRAQMQSVLIRETGLSASSASAVIEEVSPTARRRSGNARKISRWYLLEREPAVIPDGVMHALATERACLPHYAYANPRAVWVTATLDGNAKVIDPIMRTAMLSFDADGLIEDARVPIDDFSLVFESIGLPRPPVTRHIAPERTSWVVGAEAEAAILDDLTGAHPLERVASVAHEPAPLDEKVREAFVAFMDDALRQNRKSHFQVVWENGAAYLLSTAERKAFSDPDPARAGRVLRTVSAFFPPFNGQILQGSIWRFDDRGVVRMPTMPDLWRNEDVSHADAAAHDESEIERRRRQDWKPGPDVKAAIADHLRWRLKMGGGVKMPSARKLFEAT